MILAESVAHVGEKTNTGRGSVDKLEKGRQLEQP